jgi:hypothetical protein
MDSLQIESTLRFDFPRNWQAIKYDDSEFHQQRMMPLQEVKASDIVAMPPDTSQLYLFEVKDFRPKDKNSGRCDDYKKFVNIVAKKTLSTIAGLYLAPRTIDKSVLNYSHRLLHNPRHLQVIFFMQEDPLPVGGTYDYRRIMLDRRQKLREVFGKLGLEAELYSLDTPVASMPWVVTDLYTPSATPPPAIPSRPKKKKK